MKKSLIFILSGIFFLGCSSNEPKQEAAKTDSTVKKETLAYPFTPKYSLNWQPGDEQNAVLVLNSIKKHVDGDIKGALSYFGDSITFITDEFLFKGRKDSLETLLTSMRTQLTSMSFEPDTWITAYYPDDKDTWVTVWGTQKWTTKKGKIDSFYLVEDFKVKDGKILEIDEKMRRYPEPKPKK